MEACGDGMPLKQHTVNMMPHGELPGSTPTIARPDLDRDQNVNPKALRPHTVISLGWTTLSNMLPRAMRQRLAPFTSRRR
jgi:hypothetical protein